MDDHDDVTLALFNLLNKSVNDFKQTNETFFNEKGYGEVVANAICMLNAMLIEKIIPTSDLEKKISLSKDIYDQTNKFIFFLENQNRNKSN